MRWRFWFVGLAGCAGYAAWPVTALAFDPNDPGASGYKLAFSDDFHSLDTSVWELDWWYDAGHEPACQTDFLPGTVLTSPAGLRLHIQSLEAFPNCVSEGLGYSWAHLDSYRAFSQKLGYFEARIRSSGAGGTLTAFWLLPASGAWPPELDVEEIRGDVPNIAYLTNHYGRRDRQSQYVFTAPQSLGAAFHTYGALITAADITWSIDGVKRERTILRAGESAKLFPIFSLYTGNCGDGWAGCPEKTTGWSADAEVQWVRVWRAPAQH